MASRVSPDRCFREDPVPDLGLWKKLSFPLRVYVLACEDGCVYVGISPSAKLTKRVDKQFDGLGSAFCRQHKPLHVLYVWPAADPAIETAVYYAMMGKMFPNARANMYVCRVQEEILLPCLIPSFLAENHFPCVRP